MKRTFTHARNPAYANAEETLINLEVKFTETGDEWLPFTADPNDPEAHGRDIYSRAAAGEFGTIQSYQD